MTPQQERISTSDSDFLDLDWYKQGKNTLTIICHGLEGNSRKPYMLGMAKAITNGMPSDVLTWNYRGCSTEMNRTNRFYHSGATDDLEIVINHGIKQGYKSLALIGFSLGGNLVLKYLGENGDKLDSKIKGAVAFSVPLDLESSSVKMKGWENYLYTKRFLKSLKRKIKTKESLKFESLALDQVKNVKDLFHFDDLFTGPLHGFEDARDYYRSCSSLFFLDSIKVPTLIVNARNDPFLSEACFPFQKLNNNEKVNLEAPEHGGHCGFSDFNSSEFWSEKRAVEFIKSFL
jgi:predicted alpha/beta-fold hydrolase